MGPHVSLLLAAKCGPGWLHGAVWAGTGAGAAAATGTGPPTLRLLLLGRQGRRRICVCLG